MQDDQIEETGQSLSGEDLDRFRRTCSSVVQCFESGAASGAVNPGDCLAGGRVVIIQSIPAAAPKYLAFDLTRRLGLTVTFFPGSTASSFCNYVEKLFLLGAQDRFFIVFSEAGLCQFTEEPATIRVERRDHPLGTLAAYLPFLGMLARAHALGFVHGSIGPDTLVLSQTDFSHRLLDCGLAQEVAKPILYGYAAPEQLKGEKADQRSDQFSICAVIWESVFGAHPFVGECDEERKASISSDRRRDIPKPEGISNEIVGLLEKGLSAAPADRFDSMVALRDALAETAQKCMVEEFEGKSGLDAVCFAPPVLEKVSMNEEGAVLSCPRGPPPTGNEIDGKWLDLENRMNPFEEGELIAELVHQRFRRSEWNRLSPNDRGIAREVLVRIAQLRQAFAHSFFPEEDMKKTSAKALTHVIEPFLRQTDERTDNEYAEAVTRRMAWMCARKARPGLISLLRETKKEDGLPCPSLQRRVGRADEINLLLKRNFLQQICTPRDLETESVKNRGITPRNLADNLLMRAAGISIDDLVRTTFRERLAPDKARGK